MKKFTDGQKLQEIIGVEDSEGCAATYCIGNNVFGMSCKSIVVSMQPAPHGEIPWAICTPMSAMENTRWVNLSMVESVSV